jgi:hypothetical protein
VLINNPSKPLIIRFLDDRMTVLGHIHYARFSILFVCTCDVLDDIGVEILGD